MSLRRYGRAAAALLGVAGVLAAGRVHSELGDFFKGFGGSIFGKPAENGAPAAPRAEDVRCPAVDIQAGTETLTVRTAAKAAEPGSVRHQINVGQTARECWLDGDMLHLKVGVAGRVILGPAGTPGSYPVPVRIAVTRGLDNVVYSKLGHTTATVPPGADSAPYTYIDESVAFRLPEGDRTSNYIVHVGLDEKPDKPEKPRKRAHRPR